MTTKATHLVSEWLLRNGETRNHWIATTKEALHDAMEDNPEECVSQATDKIAGILQDDVRDQFPLLHTSQVDWRELAGQLLDAVKETAPDRTMNTDLLNRVKDAAIHTANKNGWSLSHDFDSAEDFQTFIVLLTIKMAMKDGYTLEQAYDVINGPGSFQAMSGHTWQTLQEQ